MNCARCERLEDEVADLKSRLMVDVHESLLLSAKWDLTPNQAWIVHELYKANGKPIPPYMLYEGRPIQYAGDEEANLKQNNLITVVMCHIRRKLGPNFIHTVNRAGYALTDRGLEEVQSVFSRQSQKKK